MSEANYKIKIKKGNMEIEVQGDKDFVISKFDELKEEFFETSKEEIVKHEVISVEKKGLPETLPTFLNQKGNPDSFLDKTMIFSYWLFHKEKVDPINAKDIEHCYDLTRLRKSKNIPQDLMRNQKKGYLIPLEEEKDGRSTYRLSQEGEKYVEEMEST